LHGQHVIRGRKRRERKRKKEKPLGATHKGRGRQDTLNDVAEA